MNEETTKRLLDVAISVGLVLFGWLLAQGTTWISNLIKRRRQRLALEAELEDLLKGCEQLKRVYERDLKIFGAGAVSGMSPIDLPNHIYTSVFAEISPWLKQSQRRSFNLIYSFAAEVNIRAKRTVKLAEEYFEGGEKDERIKRLFGEYCYSQFVTVSKLMWHLTYHLENRRDPDFYASSDLLKELGEVEAESVEKARTIAKSTKGMVVVKYPWILDEEAQ